MTIRPGDEWGAPAVLPEGAPIADSDATLHEIVGRWIRGHDDDGPAMGPIGLIGGSLWRTMGQPSGGAERLASGGTGAPVDVATVLLDGRVGHFVTHLVARRRGPLGWWRGPVLVLMNAEYLGDWDVATRGHPNDGRVDLFAGDLSLGDRWKARRRLPTGGHVPHPGITERRVKGHTERLPRGTHVWLDGLPQGPVTDLAVQVRPDALNVIV